MNAPVFKTDAYIIEVEQNVLGALMFDGDARDTMAILADRHFVYPFHQHLYRAIKSAREQYGTGNPVVVAKLIPDIEKTWLKKNSGEDVMQYLARLLGTATAGASASVENAKKIIDQWARLNLANEAGRVYAAANDPQADVRLIAHEAASAIDDIMSDVRAGASRKTRVSIGSAAGRAFEAASEARHTGTGLTGITWGLSDLNRLTGGIQRKDLTLVGARPSMGKTTFALSVAMKAAAAGSSIGFVSLEMDADKLACRAISDALYDWRKRVPYTSIIRGTMTDEEFDMVAEEQARMNALPILIDDQAGQTVTDIRTRAERLVEETQAHGNRLAVLFIDHLGLIRASSRYSGNRVNEIAEITSSLKGMARDLDIGVVLLSQLNRAVESRENKRPQLSDLRDSGAIEQDADTIAFIYRDAYYLERGEGGTPEEQFERADRLEACRNVMEFSVAKQRNGGLETVNLFADMAFSAVRNGARS
ncbi:replicative DNA helicase [Aliirhizobium cellulosilyticum]|uniref:DNA 5'-3' helicase n=1 Tax=Aliirhizobium cellulosilyticum TaxID=393664 RepID=A0A7W6T9W8_9HYPH|nr:DnaB-like helicase C-terminal domain-containing protein [Rhizobium cellulosilyticum]MBB4347972.1 replicative DNA helicase [Rhizobium cellulosilyticum]MBB4409634.1 replicative DNA helicase [Rhizobium cellulosilyticum]MBB4444322.1 replicative DNA helicase [Rhizobium cellulosilyticum]